MPRRVLTLALLLSIPACDSKPTPTTDKAEEKKSEDAELKARLEQRAAERKAKEEADKKAEEDLAAKVKEVATIPEGTKGRYMTVVNERGEIHICPEYPYSLDRSDKVVVKFWLMPDVLEDLKNAAWHTGRNLARLLEHAALLELAKLELLHNEGSPFPPRPRGRKKRPR